MTALVGVVGDFNPKNRNHLLTNAAFDHVGLPFDWVPTNSIRDAPEKRLARCDGFLIASGSPYRSMDGALAAIRYARERGVPLVGT